MTDEWNSLKTAWQHASAPANQAPVPLQAAQLRAVVAGRMRREQRAVRQYIWASACWQLLLYGALGYLAVRFRTDGLTVAYCVGGLLLYLPFTAVFAQKFGGYARQSQGAAGLSGHSIAEHLRTQRTLLHQFFRFKKRFDWVSLPLTAGVMVLLAAKLTWVPTLAQAAGPSGALFLLILGAFGWATVRENARRFVQPLQHMQALIQELEAMEHAAIQ